MREDPVVKEVRKHRDALARRFGYDIKAIAEYLRSQEKESGHPIVRSAAPKRRSKGK